MKTDASYQFIKPRADPLGCEEPVAAGSINAASSRSKHRIASFSPCSDKDKPSVALMAHSVSAFIQLQSCSSKDKDTHSNAQIHRFRDWKSLQNKQLLKRRRRMTWVWLLHGSSALLLRFSVKAAALLRSERRPFREPFHHLQRSMCFPLAAAGILETPPRPPSSHCNYPPRKKNCGRNGGGTHSLMRRDQ